MRRVSPRPTGRAARVTWRPTPVGYWRSVSEEAVSARTDTVGGVGSTPYDCFVSYSHVSLRLATCLEDGLRRMAKPWYARRALHVFRDTTGLSVTPDLWSSICAALDGSRFFILITSPATAASPWVGRELQRWLETKSPERILIVLTEGTIEWADTVGDFDWERSNALSPTLRGVFPHEPLYLDLRWAAEETELNLRHPRFRMAVAELAGPIHGRPTEDLESDDLREHHKLQRAAQAGVSTLVLLLVLALLSTAVALQQRGQARHAAALAGARAASAEALNQLQTGRNGLAQLLAVAADHLASGPATRAALLQSLEAEPGLLRDFATTGTVGSAAFSPDGTLLAAEDAGTIRVWEVATGRQLPHPIAPPPGRGTGPLAFADGGRLVASYSYQEGLLNSVEIFDTQKGAHVQSIPTEAFNWTASAETSRLAFVDSQGDAEVWDGRTGQLLKRLPHVRSGADDFSVGLALSPDGSTLVVGGVRRASPEAAEFNETMDAWTVDTAEPVGRTCQSDIGGRFDGMFHMNPDVPQVLDTFVDARAPSVTTLLSGGTRGIVVRCDLVTGEAPVTTVSVPTTATAPVSGISSDGSVTATRDVQTGTAHLYDTSGAEIRPSVQEPSLSPGEFGKVIFSPDSRLVGLPGNSIGEMKVWHTHDDDDVLSKALPIPGGVRLVSLDPQAKSMLVTNEAGDREVVDRTTGRVTVTVPSSVVELPRCGLGFQAPVTFVGSGRSIAVPYQTEVCEPPFINLSDTRTGAARRIDVPPAACAASLTSVALSGDDRTLAVGCEGRALDPAKPGDQATTVARIDISTARPRVLSVDSTTLRPHRLVVSPDGRTIVVAEEEHAGAAFQIMRLVGNHLEGGPTEPANGGFVGPAIFSPKGRELATSYSDGRIVLWRLGPRGLERVQLAATGPDAVTSLAFSPDGSALAVGDSAGGIRLWDSATAALLGRITRQQQNIDSMGFLTDGRTLIALSSASSDAAGPPGSLVSVAVDRSAWIRAACSIVNRNLTPTEWRQFLPTATYRPTCPGSSR